jgi:iron complex transport system permease protein
MKKYFVLIIFSILVLIAAPFFGVKNFGILDLKDSQNFQIFFELRVPRVIVAFLVGAILSVCGVVYQLIFKNPLASPYTLGISSGAALGASISIIFGVSNPLITGLICTFLVAWLVYRLSVLIRDNISNQILLSGVMISFFCSGIILLLQYIANFSEVFRITRWLMGNIETFDYSSIILLICSLTVLIFFIALKHRELSLISIDSEYAVTKGVPIQYIFKGIFVVTSFCIATVVTLCGPIGFVGIAVPYIAKKIVGFSIINITIFSLFLGGSLLVMCDALSRILASPAEIPVGVITAVLASPIVLMILIKKD